MEVTILPFLDMDFKFELCEYQLAPLKLLKSSLEGSTFEELCELQEKNNLLLKEIYGVEKGNLVVLIARSGSSKLFIDSLFFICIKVGMKNYCALPIAFLSKILSM